MISKTLWQPKGLHWEIKMHLVLPWKREQPEAFHCPHPSSNKAASQLPALLQDCSVGSIQQRSLGFEEVGQQGMRKRATLREIFQRSICTGKGQGGWQVQLWSCRAARRWLQTMCKALRGFWCFPRSFLHLVAQYFRFHRKINLSLERVARTVCEGTPGACGVSWG